MICAVKDGVSINKNEALHVGIIVDISLTCPSEALAKEGWFIRLFAYYDAMRRFGPPIRASNSSLSTVSFLISSAATASNCLRCFLSISMAFR